MHCIACKNTSNPSGYFFGSGFTSSGLFRTVWFPPRLPYHPWKKSNQRVCSTMYLGGPYLERPRPSRRYRRRHRRWSGRWPPHETFAKLAMVPHWLNCTLDVDWADIGTFVGFWSLVGLRIWGWQRPGVDWYFLVERSESCWDPEMWKKNLVTHCTLFFRINVLPNLEKKNHWSRFFRKIRQAKH